MRVRRACTGDGRARKTGRVKAVLGNMADGLHGAAATDLALEVRESLLERLGETEIPGVSTDQRREEHLTVTRLTISGEEGARALGKAPGVYVTLEAPELRQRNRDVQEAVSQALARELAAFFEPTGLGSGGLCLVVGLGNPHATPDALGPKAVARLLVTRHLYELSPPELRGGLRPVAAIAPSVMGMTGMETGEIVKGIINQIQPKAVIVVDALAARSSERLFTTVQLADTGLEPGAGVGNRRMGINQQTMGVPVLAVGVPTVIHAVTIVQDALKHLGASQSEPQPAGPSEAGDGFLDPGRIRLHQTSAGAAAAEAGGGLEPPAGAWERAILERLLQPYMGSMIVTPKEVDDLVDDVSDVIAGGLNSALHPSVDLTDVLRYLAH